MIRICGVWRKVNRPLGAAKPGPSKTSCTERVQVHLMGYLVTALLGY